MDQTMNYSSHSETSIVDYNGESCDKDIERTHSRVDTCDARTIEKMESLARTLSTHKCKDGPVDIDLNDPELAELLSDFVGSADSQGIKLRKTGMTFKNIESRGVDATFSFAPTAGDIALFPWTIFNKIRESKRVGEKKIIRNVNGIIRAGEMCLVLGRPGAGCSTLLKTLAGEHDQFTGVDGDLRFDGIPSSEMFKEFRGDVIYNGELDVHFPHLTVDQTLKFAIACKMPHTRVNGVSQNEYIEHQRDFLATIFGLRHALGTKVGNDFVRGVSGGERKRVSIAEALAARGSVYMWDNATRGLDSAMAVSYTRSIRTMTNLLGSVAYVTLYQAGESIYEMFDKVTILYDGRQIYFGPVESAKQYFETMGFQCPQRQVTPEFLTAVTDPNGRTPMPGFEHKVPKTAEEFEQYWLASPEYARLIQEIDTQVSRVDAGLTKANFAESMKQEKGKHARMNSQFCTSFQTQIKLCTVRAFQRIRGDSAYTVTNILAALIQALISGSLYYKLPETTIGAFSRTGLLYWMILYFSLMGLAQLPNVFLARPVLLKHKSYSMYHPGAEALAATVSDFPFRLIAVTLFYVVNYFMAHLRLDAGRFFLTFLFLVVGSEAVTLVFQTVAAFSDTVSQANALAGVLILAMSLYSTYLIQYPYMHGWAKYWIPYLNPIRWTLESMLMSEFEGREMKCANYIPHGPAYENATTDNLACAFIGAEKGNPVVNAARFMKIQYGYTWSHVWRNFGIIIAFYVVFTFLNAFFTEIKRPVKSGGDHLSFKRGKVQLPSHTNDTEKGTTNELPVTDTDFPRDSAFQGLRGEDIFTWKNVDYVIPYQGSTRKLLDNVQGYVKPGSLTALMGASGAGKTTLLNTLSQRIDFGTITGDMLVNGKSSDASFKRSTGYVQQQDLHIPELTVRESLQFAARMRRPNTVPDTEKMEYVEKIIEVLDMSMYADAIVGETGFGLNFEQRKKLSIGVELVAKPSLLLFLDEPTSGLDSESSRSIIQLLRKLAEAGQAIMCTIHQPSATLFESFDRLLLLQRGGQTIYFGDIGENSSTMLQYFESKGARKCEKRENPAEYILEVIGASGVKVDQDWHQVWTNSEEYETVCKEIDSMVAELAAQPKNDAGHHLSDTFAVPYTYQFKHLMLRTMMQFWRDPEYIGSKLSLMIMSGLFNGFTFYNINASVVGMQACMFSVFMAIIVSAPMANQIQARGVASRELFEARESKSNTFHWALLLISQYLNEIPYHIVFSTLFFFCYYFPLRVDNSASTAGVFYLNYCIMFQLYYVGFSLMVLYMSPNLPSAAVLTGLFFSFMISFNGVVQPARLMPVFWRRFMYNVSPYTYFMQNFLGIILHNKPVKCADNELTFFDPPAGQTCAQYTAPFLENNPGYIVNPDDVAQCGYCQYKVADQYLTTLDISHSQIWRNFGLFWVYIVFNVFAMLVVYYYFSVRKTSFRESWLGKLLAKKAE